MANMQYFLDIYVDGYVLSVRKEVFICRICGALVVDVGDHVIGAKHYDD